jgi:cytochrome c oxidase subunit 3
VLANSATLFGASAALEAARRGRGRQGTALALVLGLAFLAGQVAAFVALAEGPAQVWSRPQGAFFFLLASVHGLHLLGGIVALAWLLRRGSPPRLVAWYWHFLALVWVYLVVLLRLP